MKLNRDERPWGWFEVLFAEAEMKVKRILVLPGKRLSLQSHRHRAENWIVVRGTARITLDGKNIDLAANETVFIPQNSRHRVENIGKNDLLFFEVQTGTYLGEDDIVRYEDDYNRV